MAEECNNHHGVAVLLSFLLGAAVGGGLALLMAPRSGEETRGQLRAAGDDAVDRLQAVLGEAEEKLRGPLEEIQELLKDKKEIFLAAVEAGKQAAREKAEQKQSESKPGKAAEKA